jgi:hypothetical protein
MGQKWRFRRNLVIYLAWKAGVSEQTLADVFLLARSRIGAILDDVKALGLRIEDGESLEDILNKGPYRLTRTTRKS